MNPFLALLLLLGLGASATAQRIEAINEDSTRRVVFGTGNLVECVAEVQQKPVTIRGHLRLIDPTEFRLETAPGQFTTVQLASVLRLRRVSRRYVRQALLAGGPPLAYVPMGQTPQVSEAVAALVAGVGIAALRGDLNGPGRGPSAYQGWVFVFKP